MILHGFTGDDGLMRGGCLLLLELSMLDFSTSSLPGFKCHFLLKKKLKLFWCTGEELMTHSRL
jgi:hypothetical protein